MSVDFLIFVAVKDCDFTSSCKFSTLRIRQGTDNGPSGVVVNLLDQKLWNQNPDFFSYTLSKAAKMEEGRTERELIALKRKHDAAIQAILGIKEELESAQGTLVAALRAKEAAEKAATAVVAQARKLAMGGKAIDGWSCNQDSSGSYRLARKAASPGWPKDAIAHDYSDNLRELLFKD